MDRLWIGLALVAVFVIGLLYLKTKLRTLREKIDFLNEFRERFVKLANSLSYTSGFGHVHSFDHELYNWLTLNSVKAQLMVGGHGEGEVIGPFRMWKAKNYQFIINTLPNMRNGMVHHQEVTMVDDCLIRCIGDKTSYENELIKEIKNPTKWLQNGVRLVVSFPVRLLKWFGIIPENMFLFLVHNWVFKLISGIAALIGFVSGVVGLITGWQTFMELVKTWL